jgi:uncharacterized membrane protein
MSEKRDSHLIVAQFPTAEEAHAAGQHLKEWDKDYDGIDLGAMSILTLDENGKLKEDKVGERRARGGAKWGGLAGAALGILSGGVTLIGGAIVGLAAGALGGSLFHQKIGMTDEDQAKLEQHLKDGGAALAVMMDYDEIEGTLYELNSLGAEVATYNVPQEVLDDMQKMYRSEKVIHDRLEADESVEMAGEEPD